MSSALWAHGQAIAISLLTGKPWLAPPSNMPRRNPLTANYLTAAVCKLTGNNPATACTPAVTALQSHLG